MMKLMATSDSRAEPPLPRERTYPVLMTIDLLLHWSLCLAILGVAAGLLGIIVINTSPQIPQHFWHFAMKLRG